MNSFFRDVISKLINAEFQGRTSFKVADNKAVGDNPVRELHLDAVPVNDDQSIISLAWEGGNKLFEKTLPSEEAKHNFELISSDMSEAVSLTANGKIDEAKKLMESLVNKYSEQSGERVPTNLPPVTTTQAAMNCPHCPHAINEHHTGCEAKGCRCEMTPHLIKNYKESSKEFTCPLCFKVYSSKEAVKEHMDSYHRMGEADEINRLMESSKDEFAGLWKQAKVSLRNIFPSGTIQDLTFDTQEELSSYQEKMKQLNPQDQIPLWDINKGKSPEGEESTEIAPPSLSYDQIEKEKEKEHKNLEKSIDEKIKTEVESALIEKAATVFGPDQVELVEVLRKNGRNWDEIKKILVKDFNFDKEATTIFVDDLRSKEEGPDSNLPEAPKPPENLVSPETHDKLLEDLDKPVDEKKNEPPVKEPIKEESAKVCPRCGEPHKGDILREHLPNVKDLPMSKMRPEDFMSIPEEKESSKKCPKCGEDVWDTSTVDQRLNKCWNCGTRFDNPEAEASQEIARADNAEIRKVADLALPKAVKDEVKGMAGSIYRMNAPNAKLYLFTVQNGKLYSGAYSYAGTDYGDNKYPYAFNMETGEFLPNPTYKANTQASLNKKALNPLQEPPVVEQPTAETSNQDIVPISQTPDHDTPKKGDRVFVMSDLGEEKAGFEGTYVSEYTSKGNQYAIIETDEKDLLDVEMHRVSKVSENTSPEPAIEPNVQKPEEPDIEVTPKMEDLHSSLKMEAGPVYCKHDGCNRKGVYSKRDGYWCEKHINESTDVEKDAYLEDIKAEVKKLEAQLKTAEEEKDVCSKCNKEVGLIEMSKWVRDGFCSECRGTEKKADNVMDTKCEDCGKPLGPEVFLSKWPVCGECTRKKHKKVTGTEKESDQPKKRHTNTPSCGCGGDCAILPDSKAIEEGQDVFDNKQSINVTDPKSKGSEPDEVSLIMAYEDGQLDDAGILKLFSMLIKNGHAWSLQGHYGRTAKALIDSGYINENGTITKDVVDTTVEPEQKLLSSKYAFKKQAADPVPAKTEYKELKKAPDYVDPKSAVPASPDMEQVLVKMESLQSKLSVLDQAKEKIKMAMQEELKKIDVGGERSQIEKELQDSYEKLGILIDATENKVINWSDQLYTLQHQEKEVVPQPTTGELLAKIYAKFDGAEKYVESVLNGFKALAKKFETKRLVKWPKRSSLESVEKEASVVDDLNQMNQQMLEALNLLSEPLA